MEDEERKNEFQRELRAQLEQTMVQGTSMDAVTLRLKTNRKQALKNRERAEAVLARRHKPTACLKNDEALMLYYKSALCFQLSGQWQDAGDSLVLCAKLLRRQGMHGQAGAVFTEAAESYLKVDLEEASRTYEVSASAYCDQGRFDIAGKIELLIADIQLRNKHWGEAILHYKRAATYFTGEQALDLCDLCWERIAECHVEIAEYAVAFEYFKKCAESCVGSNLRRFNSKMFLLKAMLALLAVPATDYAAKYSAALQASSELEVVDYLWTCCKEHLFIKNVIKACNNLDLNAFADHVFYWNNVRPLDRLCIKMLSNLKDAVVGEHAQLRELEDKQRHEATMLAKAKEEEHRRDEELRVLGVDPAIT